LVEYELYLIPALSDPAITIYTFGSEYLLVVFNRPKIQFFGYS